MKDLRTPAEIAEMKPAGAFVSAVLDAVEQHAKIGVNLLELDEIAHQMIRESGAKSCYIDYHPTFGDSPFGKVICTSVNDAVLHGLPHNYHLQDGDLLSIDFAISLNGWVADSARSFNIGTSRPADKHLINTTEIALDAAIDAAQPGGRLGDISAAISAVCTRAGYQVNTQFGGHGVGRTMHQEPHVPNAGLPGRGMVLEPGLVIALEPWLMAGTKELRKDPDGWTLRSLDGSRGAHSEHTVAITETGPLVLTRPHSSGGSLGLAGRNVR